MNKVKNKNNFLNFFVIFLTSFLLGVIFSFNVGQKINNGLLKNTDSGNIISILGESELDLTKFWEAYNLIKLYNYNSDWINKKVLVDSAIKWLVDGLWDKNSEFLNTEDTKKFNEVLLGDFEWIWAVVEVNPMGVVVDRIIKGSPAKIYGLQSWDIIIKANEISLEWLSLFDAVDKIKGPAGTKVMLEIIRSWENNVLKIELIRDKIKIPSIDTKVFDDTNIAYIAINMFWEDTSIEFEKALNENMNTKWLIIDLRDNWGWYLQSAVSILSNLIEDDKVLVVTKYKDLFSNISYPSINNWNIYKWKIVVLINENSASASEITAWALKDYNKAILVWKKSYGKWSVQKPFDLSDWSMLKLTIAKWFTPNDVNIDKEGIVPDIEVDFKKEDYTPEQWKENDFTPYDRQLEVAKEVLNIFIENEAYKLSIDKSLEKYPNKNIEK